MVTNDLLEAKLIAARGALNGAGDLIGSNPQPRYELFHAATSICSQKVRGVLAHHGLSYVSHSMNLFHGQTYLPDYVRLRMHGCEAQGGRLAWRHSGSTAAERYGCDGAVVPTLIDHERREVLVDSRLICLYLDATLPEHRRLRPARRSAAVEEQLAIVDDLPNYQMLMGRTPGETERLESRTDILAAFSLRKVAWCDRRLAEHEGDETLVRAYAAKRAKEASAADWLFSPQAMQAARSDVESALNGLERVLAQADGAWLLGDRVTMADLFWGIELIRLGDVAAASFWEGGALPGVERYLTRVQALPAIRRSVLDWPGARF